MFLWWSSEKVGKASKGFRKVKMQVRTPSNIMEEGQITNELDEWRIREELLWKQRSRVDWLKEGDLNTEYFHARASQMYKTNRITKLLKKDGIWVTDREALKVLAVEHFTNVSKFLGNLIPFIGMIIWRS